MMRLMSPSAETNKQLRVWGTERHDLAHYRIAEVKVDTLTSSSGTFLRLPRSHLPARKLAKAHCMVLLHVKSKLTPVVDVETGADPRTNGN